MEPKINSYRGPDANPKKRILFIVTQSELGGAQYFLRTLVTRLDKNRFEILVAAGPNFSIKYSVFSIKYDLLDALEKEDIKTIRLKYLFRDINPWYDLLASWELRRVIRDFQPHTIFLNSSKVGFLGSFVAKHLIRNTKYKILYRIGGWSFNDPRPGWQKKLWIILEKISARWKDIIIVNNKHDFEQAKRLKINPKGELLLIHNGLDVYKTGFLPREEARLKLFERALKDSAKIFGTKTIVGTIANFYPTKGLEYLIVAAEKFKEDDRVSFFIIGDGQERENLERSIREKGLERKVFLLGKIPEASRLMSGFDIFLLPSLKEGFPWSLLEAMAAKLPVIATKVGAIPEIIEDGKNGFVVNPKDYKAMGEKIKNLIKNERLAEEMGIQAHQTVLFKFPLEKMVKETKSLL